ncbi:Rha family transcriptional regulator [Paraburkholderia sp. MM6662-R1]|uniref:Rha family transcriptional regulator n=1 Tax=Paraburkholderia sp. MM6662-R1 TaxID=2991066 RepID=UPI003D22DCE8
MTCRSSADAALQENAMKALSFQDFVMLDGVEPVTDTRIVAAHFGKLHKNVLRDVAALLRDCPPEFGRLNFEPVEYRDAKGEARPAYRMTKDGFMLLVMGFTGAKALAVKVAFIAAFNAMADYIRNRDRSVWDQIHELEKRDAASLELARFGSRQMLKRKAELPQIVAQFARLNHLTQPSLFSD